MSVKGVLDKNLVDFMDFFCAFFLFLNGSEKIRQQTINSRLKKKKRTQEKREKTDTQKKKKRILLLPACRVHTDAVPRVPCAKFDTTALPRLNYYTQFYSRI
jgi:hypothetical protein